MFQLEIVRNNLRRKQLPELIRRQGPPDEIPLDLVAAERYQDIALFFGLDASAMTLSFMLRAIAIIAVTIALLSGSSGRPNTNDLSILSFLIESFLSN